MRPRKLGRAKYPHGAGRGQAPARVWREFEVGTWYTLSACATRLSAPSGAYAQLRSKTRYAQLRRHLPQGSCKVWGQLADSLAPRGSQRAIACMSAQRGGCCVARPAVLHAGLPFRLCGAAGPLLGIMGALPPNPRAPQSLADRRRWGGVRTPLRRGPRQARCTGLPRVAR